MGNRIVTVDSRQFDVSLERDGAVLRASEHVLEIAATREDELDLRVDGRLHTVPYVIRGSVVYFMFDGETYVADVADKGGPHESPAPRSFD